MKKFLRICLLILNCCAIIALLTANLALVVQPTHNMLSCLPAFLGLGYEWILLVNVSFLVLWLFTHHKLYALLSLCALMVSYTPIRSTIRFSTHRVEETTHRLKVFTYNTQRMGLVLKPKRNEVLKFLAEQDADVLCLQEFETNKQPSLLSLNEVKTALSGKFPYSYIDFKLYKGNRQYGLAVFSRYPLLHKETIHYKSAANLSDFCDVVVDGDTIRLCNNHLQSYRLEKEDLNQVDVRNSNTTSLLGTARKLRSGLSLRATQAQYVYSVLQHSSYPVIVCGDLNDVPVSFAYHNLRGDLDDAFLDGSAWSLGHTFSYHWWGVRIDHIFHSSSLKVIESEVLSVDYSDHRPVTATFVW